MFYFRINVINCFISVKIIKLFYFRINVIKLFYFSKNY